MLKMCNATVHLCWPFVCSVCVLNSFDHSSQLLRPQLQLMDRMTAGACTCILCRQLLPRWLSWSQIRHESDVQSYCKLHGWRTEDDIWLTRHCA